MSTIKIWELLLVLILFGISCYVSYKEGKTAGRIEKEKEHYRDNYIS